MKDVGVRVPLPALEVHMSVELWLSPLEGESYREAVVRMQGDEIECVEEYDRLVALGVAEDRAAWRALHPGDSMVILRRRI